MYSLVAPRRLPAPLGIALSTSFYVAVVALVVATGVCSGLDPSDPLLGQPARTDYFCLDCNGYVQGSSKHCKSCKRCTSGFDHHCKWINNCVGSRNYSWFIAMIIAQKLVLALYLASAIVLIVRDSDQVDAALAVFWAVGVCALAMWVFVVNLIVFHIVLWCKGMTTYEFLVTGKVTASEEPPAAEIYAGELAKYEEARKSRHQDHRATGLDGIRGLNNSVENIEL